MTKKAFDKVAKGLTEAPQVAKSTRAPAKLRVPMSPQQRGAAGAAQRNKNMTPKQRSEIARRGGKARAAKAKEVAPPALKRPVGRPRKPVLPPWEVATETTATKPKPVFMFRGKDIALPSGHLRFYGSGTSLVRYDGRSTSMSGTFTAKELSELAAWMAGNRPVSHS